MLQRVRALRLPRKKVAKILIIPPPHSQGRGSQGRGPAAKKVAQGSPPFILYSATAAHPPPPSVTMESYTGCRSHQGLRDV